MHLSEVARSPPSLDSAVYFPTFKRFWIIAKNFERTRSQFFSDDCHSLSNSRKRLKSVNTTVWFYHTMLTFSINFCLLIEFHLTLEKWATPTYLVKAISGWPQLFKRCVAPLSTFWLQPRGPGFKNTVILLASFKFSCLTRPIYSLRRKKSQWD